MLASISGSAWSLVGVFLLPALALQMLLSKMRPGPRTVVLLGYALCGLVALAVVCAASEWRYRGLADEHRSEMDRAYVRLLRTIDTAKDMACFTPTPKTTDETLLNAYTQMRTTCVYYTIIWIEAGQSSDVDGVLAAAEKPWPAGGSLHTQLWTYQPLVSTAGAVERLRAGMPLEPGLAAPLIFVIACAFAFAFALGFIVALGKVLVELRRRPG